MSNIIWEGSLVKIKDDVKDHMALETVPQQGLVLEAKKNDTHYKVQFFDGKVRSVHKNNLEIVSGMPADFAWKVGDLVREWFDYEIYAIAPCVGRVTATYIGAHDMPAFDVLWSNDLRTVSYQGSMPKYLIKKEQADSRILEIRDTGEDPGSSWSTKEYKEELIERFEKYGPWWKRDFDGLDVEIDFETPSKNDGWFKEAS
jgi:hypothetical protein